MLRRFAVTAVATAALLVPAGAALAATVNHPGAGTGDCGVEEGSITVLDGQTGTVFHSEGGEVSLEGCW
jgi:hypothetical protein